MNIFDKKKRLKMKIIHVFVFTDNVFYQTIVLLNMTSKSFSNLLSDFLSVLISKASNLLTTSPGHKVRLNELHDWH